MVDAATQLFRDLNEINFINVFLILATAYLLTMMVERGLPQITKRLPSKMRFAILPSIPVLRLIIQVVAIIWVVPLFINPTFESLIAILGAVGLAIGFAFKDYVSSLVAGVVTVYERPYRPGDWVEINGAYGEVKSVGLRSLRLVTADDTTVVIPHQAIWTNNVYNGNDGARTLMCVAHFYLRPNHNASTVRQKLRDISLTSPYIQLEKPVLVVLAEEPWGTHYQLKAYPIDSRDQFQFLSDMTVRGKQALSLLGVEAVEAIPVVGGR